MHSSYKNGTYPLQSDVLTVLKNKSVMFQLKESHSELKDYYLTRIKVNTSNNLCNEEYREGLIIWDYKPKLPEEKISVLPGIFYKGKGKKSTLKENTLYTVEIGFQKIKNSKYGRVGLGLGVFVLKNKGEILFGYDYDSINKLCKEY